MCMYITPLSFRPNNLPKWALSICRSSTWNFCLNIFDIATARLARFVFWHSIVASSLIAHVHGKIEELKKMVNILGELHYIYKKSSSFYFSQNLHWRVNFHRRRYSEKWQNISPKTEFSQWIESFLIPHRTYIVLRVLL